MSQFSFYTAVQHSAVDTFASNSGELGGPLLRIINNTKSTNPSLPLPFTIRGKEIKKCASQNKGYKTKMTGPHACFKEKAKQKEN